MPSTSSHVGIAAIIENLLKRKWSQPILNYLEKGIDPVEIVKREPNLSGHVLSERLRSMLRYRIIARFPQTPPLSGVEYRLTALGKKISEILKTIEELDRKYVHRTNPIDETFTPPVKNAAVIRIIRTEPSNVSEIVG